MINPWKNGVFLIKIFPSSLPFPAPSKENTQQKVEGISADFQQTLREFHKLI